MICPKFNEDGMVHNCGGCDEYRECSLCHCLIKSNEQAEIEQLRAENAKLRADLYTTTVYKRCLKAEAERDALQSRIAKLDAALKGLITARWTYCVEASEEHDKAMSYAENILIEPLLP